MADIELVIKIPEELYEAYKGRPPMLGDEGMDMIAQAIANGTPLPQNATNGDMIKALFGRPAKEGKAGILYKFKYRNGKPMFSTYFDENWWNAPYKAESLSKSVEIEEEFREL